MVSIRPKPVHPLNLQLTIQLQMARLEPLVPFRMFRTTLHSSLVFTHFTSDINFTGSKTSVAVESSGTNLVIDCGDCTGTWDFSELDISGGKTSVVDSDDATVCSFEDVPCDLH